MGAKSDDVGRLLLRLSIGGLLLPHGIAKLGSGVDMIAEGLASHGVPGLLAYAVFIGEIVAPILVLLGVFTRAAGAVIAFNMVVAVALVHTGDILKFSHGSWGLQLQALFFLGALSIALLGSGRFALRPRPGILG